MATIRQDVVKYITDRPGKVVTKDEIMMVGSWTASQVTHAILQTQRSTTIGSEIETVVRGNAWRYVPRSVAPTTGTVRPAPNLDLPVTTLIRQFLIDHAYEVVTVEQLVAYTGRRIDQVKVGVNNMRSIASNADVTAHVKVVVHGQMWRFEPPTDWRPGSGVRPSTSGRPSTATATYVLPNVDDDDETPPNGHVVATNDGDADQGRVFEEVGSLRDGRILIRDQHGDVYAATPIHSSQEQ